MNIIEHKNSKGHLHCEDGPAYIRYYENGSKEYEIYCLNNQLHKTDGPTIIYYFKNGNKKSETYYLNNLKLEDWCKIYNISFEQKYVIDNLEKIYKTFFIFK